MYASTTTTDNIYYIKYNYNTVFQMSRAKILMTHLALYITILSNNPNCQRLGIATCMVYECDVTKAYINAGKNT